MSRCWKMCRWTLVALILLFHQAHSATKNVPAGNQLEIRQGNVYQVECSKERPREQLTTFCWSGEGKTLLSLWKTATVQLTIQDEDFSIYKGDNASHVAHLHDIQQQSWFSFLPWKEKSISISPFSPSCTGVYSKANYTLRLDIRQINFNRFLMFAAGMFIFLVAATLCEKVAFHYATGTLIGVLGSILIIVYLTSRLIPKKSGAYAVLIGGSSIVFYLIRSLWENMFSILKEYHWYVAVYVVTSSVISFALCYRLGPVSNPRTIHLLQWGLQFCGLLLVFLSSEYREAAMGIILGTLIVHNFPSSLSARFRTLWFQQFPPKVRLLTDDEYFEQGRIETKKALDELRDFSRSPNCNAWKTMSRLKDPLRFAEFVEGKSHLSDREVLDYETTSLMPSDSNLTDDESDDD